MKVIDDVKFGLAQLRIASERWTGLGDVIATGTAATRLDRAAEWFARSVLRRESCGCVKRRAVLNSLFPFRPPKLVIGIPHRNDLEGVHETLLSLRSEIIGQSLRWYGRRVPLNTLIEVVIVNQPNTVEDQNRTKIIDSDNVKRQLDGWVANCTSAGLKTSAVDFSAAMGTAPAKQQCCVEAAKRGGEWIMILDSHVVFRQGVIHKLMRWLSRHKNRFSRDLFHGYLINDNDVGGYTGLKTWDDSTGLPLIGRDNLWGQWVTHADAHKADAPDRVPIESCGGWCVLSRVDQTVPSIDAANQQHRFPYLYHPMMRGFGGEETIIHEMRRANGHHVFNLPWLKAYHRFLRTSRVFYDSPWTDALRSQAIAFYELRDTLQPRCSKFVDCETPVDLLAAAWIKAGKPEQSVLETIATALAEIHAAYESNPKARRIGQAIVTLPIEAAKSLAVDTVRSGQPVIPQAPETLEQRYERLCREPSDINEHLPKLRELAAQCPHVTEFGTRSAVSTTALLAGRPKRVVTYDITKACGCGGIEKLTPDGTELILRHGPEFNTATMPQIDETDLLLVDTLHDASHVFAELDKHSPMVRMRICFHDTESPFGRSDQSGTDGGGVRGGIARWQATEEGRKWRLLYEATNNHGLQVWQRVEA